MFLYLATGACHSPAPVAGRRGCDRFRGRFDAGWDAWRERPCARQKAMRLLPAHTELSPRARLGAGVVVADRRRAARSTPATWRPSPRFLSHTDHELGRLFDRLDRRSASSTTRLVLVLSDNGASSEGGPTGSLNDGRVWNVLPRTVEEAAERLDDIGGPAAAQQLPVGLDGAPATRRSSGGSARPTRAGSAPADRGVARGAAGAAG